MKPLFLSVMTAALFAFALINPTATSAQSTNKAQVEAKTSKSTTKQTAGPFRGKLASMDKAARTITIGKRTFHITSETKILRYGKPGTIEDGVIGEQTSGGFKTAEDGRLVATKVTFGPKAETKAPVPEKKTKGK